MFSNRAFVREPCLLGKQGFVHLLIKDYFSISLLALTSCSTGSKGMVRSRNGEKLHANEEGSIISTGWKYWKGKFQLSCGCTCIRSSPFLWTPSSSWSPPSIQPSNPRDVRNTVQISLPLLASILTTRLRDRNALNKYRKPHITNCKARKEVQKLNLPMQPKFYFSNVFPFTHRGWNWGSGFPGTSSMASVPLYPQLQH